jgi:hypothetical protein
MQYSGNISASINSVWAICKKTGIGIRHNEYPEIKKKAINLKERNYSEIWKFLLENNSYNILLQDFSFFVFEEKTTGLNFSFYEVPAKPPTIEEYAIEMYQEIAPYLKDEDYADIIEEFEQYAIEYPTKMGITPVRYDYSPQSHTPGIHPASHMHIGFENEIRIYVDKILNPLAFFSFVIRQFYPDKWLSEVLSTRNLNIKNNIRRNLDRLPDKFRHEYDEYEMLLV